MTENVNVVDIFEDVLQVRFEPDYIQEIDVPTARALAFRLEEFYKTFKFPAKEQSELRPYLFPRYTTAQGLGVDYYAGEGHFDDELKFFQPRGCRQAAGALARSGAQSHSDCRAGQSGQCLGHRNHITRVT